MKRLRIGINALYMIPGGVGGTEIYLRHLLHALAEFDRDNDYFVFTNVESDESLVPQAFQNCRQKIRAVIRPWRIAWEQVVLPREIRRHNLDVLLNPGFTAPLAARCPQVTVFHDLQHKRHPEHFRWFDLPFWRMLLYGSSRVSRLLLADSEATRRDLLRFYSVPSSRIRVVPLGVDPAFFKLERRPEKFLLTVSTLHPHKNVDRLLRVFASFSRQQPGFRLVIAGLRGFAAEQLEKIRSELGLTQAVEFTGWLPREELYGLYGRAWAFVYPSTFEGFGLPVVEAMAAGIPVACSGIDPLTEICADAALLFDPGSETAMLNALYAVINDTRIRSRLSVDGPARAAHYSWRQTAQLTHAALIEAAGQA